MDKDTRFVIGIFAAIILVAAVSAFYIVERDNHIREMGKVCSQRVHDHFAPPNGNAYDALPYQTAYAMESSAQAECITRYPLSY